MVDLKPAQGNGASNAAAHPVGVVAQEQSQGDQRQRAGLLDDVSPQASGDVVGTWRAGFFENLDLHAIVPVLAAAAQALWARARRAQTGLLQRDAAFLCRLNVDTDLRQNPNSDEIEHHRQDTGQRQSNPEPNAMPKHHRKDQKHRQ